MKSNAVLKLMTPLWLLFCATQLIACTQPVAIQSDELYTPEPWPSKPHGTYQSDAAKLLVKGKAAYDSCNANLEDLKTMSRPATK